MSTIAVIQPYFYPYAGYFRLFAAADTVVMFDCVQFPRRGWVHRNRFALASGELDWLTLPLAKADRDVRIDQLRFSVDAMSRLTEGLPRFPELERARRAGNALLEQAVNINGDDVTAYLCDRLQDVTRRLNLERRMIRSSTLDLDPNLRGQARVIAIVQALGGSQYVNPSGGRELYDNGSFALAGLELRFLSPYEGAMESILSRLLSEPPEDVSLDIRAQTLLVS